MTRHEETAIAGLLGNHYGDGLVYLQGRDDRSLLRVARALGLVSDEGYLTPAGYRFWRRRDGTAATG